jgi:uncharacterized protein (TIGR02757 family)
MDKSLISLLNEKATFYNSPAFIAKDPISVPHRFTVKQDIEIAAFFAAILAWGNRTAIINNCNKLMALMNNEPYQFILHHSDEDLKPFVHFVHRTFNATDLLYFISFLKFHYTKNISLEDAFVPAKHYIYDTVQEALIGFHQYFFSIPHPQRSKKHIATPQRHSACKRLNMFLRWMVRNDNCGVDFGIWQKISPKQLICPLDVHVSRVAYRLGLLPDEKANWQNAKALTSQLRLINPQDPVLYDYALFGLGMAERY